MNQLLAFLIASTCIGFSAFAKEPTGKRMPSSARVKPVKSIICSFTEPFYTAEYSAKENELSITSPDSYMVNGQDVPAEKTMNIGDITMNNKDGVIELTYISKYTTGTTPVVLLTVNTKVKGSDGMSDKIYSAEGKLAEIPHNLGGCILRYK